MLKTLRYVLIGALAILLTVIASANRETVSLDLLPPEMERFFGLGWAVELPLFLVVGAGILAGLALGFLWEWVRESKVRSAARSDRRRVSELEREVKRLRGTVPVNAPAAAPAKTGAPHADEVLALLDRPRG